jgi:hypothetical protein
VIPQNLFLLLFHFITTSYCSCTYVEAVCHTEGGSSIYVDDHARISNDVRVLVPNLLLPT